MHKLRWHIAMLAGGSVLLMLLMILGAFHLIMNHWIDTNARESIQMTIPDALSDDTQSFHYAPEVITVFEEGDPARDDLPVQFYTKKERRIMEWAAGMPAGETMKAEIDGNSYYLLRLDSDMIESEMGMFGNPDEKSIVSVISVETDSYTSDGDMILFDNIPYDVSEMVRYVDITGELEVIRKINLAFLLAAVAVGLLGSTMGYFIGRKLEQNHLAQKQFFENTSHELKTPLTSIRGYAEGIERGVITDYPRTGRQIAAQTEKMSRLVEEILCVAKLESGAVSLEREPVQMQAFVQDCLMPFEGTVLSRGLNVSLDLQPMTVSADPDKLEHAVSNLLTNALKYAQTYIAISCGDGMLRISNDCKEISDDTLSHLFERFYTGRDGNTGIGLSLAKDLIMLHGWRIAARRTAEGICFEIRCGTSRTVPSAGT